MSYLDDITGHRFGRLVVLERLGRNPKGHYLVLCQCDCGNKQPARETSLSSGQRSCGCVRREKLIAQTTIHGQSKTPTWQSWRGMIERCYNPRSPSYKWYGARGIGVDDPRWLQFVNFRAEMGEKPPGMSLDRRENDLGYSKANCRWATPKQQTDNRRPAKHKRSVIQPDRQIVG